MGARHLGIIGDPTDLCDGQCKCEMYPFSPLHPHAFDCTLRVEIRNYMARVYICVMFVLLPVIYDV